jgi:AcrR family transcriptional regulator
VTVIALEKPRSARKIGRRARIIEEARRLIGAHGFEGLSLRKLAAAAEVTVPTIYNLIGGKGKILNELFDDQVSLIEQELAKIDADHPLDIAEAVVIEATRFIGEDENYYRSAQIAADHLGRTSEEGIDWRQIRSRAATMQENAVRLAQEQGLLRGEISAKLLGEQIFSNYRVASAAWTFRRISLEQFRHDALLGVYLYFLSDATDAFRPVLLQKLRELEA